MERALEILNPLVILAALFGILSVLSFLSAGLAFRKRGISGGTAGLLVGALFLCLAALLGTVAVSIQGYRALTREEVAAVIQIRPESPQTFAAHFRLAGGQEVSFLLAGDEIYVDAHILKWKPWANVLGLHTAYELDRVGGRYARLDDEKKKPRALYSLAESKPLNMFTLRQRYAWLEPLLDTEYGSASFVAADKPADLELRVSASGLLIRRVK